MIEKELFSFYINWTQKKCVLHKVNCGNYKKHVKYNVKIGDHWDRTSNGTWSVDFDQSKLKDWKSEIKKKIPQYKLKPCAQCGTIKEIYQS